LVNPISLLEKFLFQAMNYRILISDAYLVCVCFRLGFL